MNGLVYFCNYNIIKQKHELTKEQKKDNISIRLKYAEKQIWLLC